MSTNRHWGLIVRLPGHPDSPRQGGDRGEKDGGEEDEDGEPHLSLPLVGGRLIISGGKV